MRHGPKAPTEVDVERSLDRRAAFEDRFQAKVLKTETNLFGSTFSHGVVFGCFPQSPSRPARRFISR
jgi:hypothetical protein